MSGHDDRTRRREHVTIRSDGHHGDPATLLARAMRDNPLHVAAFGPDRRRRQARLERLFRTVLRVRGTASALYAVDDDVLVGFTAVAAPGTCRPTVAQGTRILVGVLPAGLVPTGRLLSWTGAWARHDPEEPHVHLGPFAVAPDRQGRGTGGRILAEHCRLLDVHHQVGYLETDRPENVALYERFGYVVIARARVLGVANWFLRRPAN